MAALSSAGSSTAQLVQGQPAFWSALIGSTTFVNIASTNLAGLIDNDRSLLKNLAVGGLGLVVFSPLACIWMGDTARLFSVQSIPKMISGNLDASGYAAGSAEAAFGAMGSFIEVLFFCHAIKGIPAKVMALYDAWRDLLKENLSLGAKSSAVLGGFLALITAAAIGYVGYYSMSGYYIAILNALKCSSAAGELCWLSNALDLSSIAIDFIAKVQQACVGMVNASAIVPVFTKLLQAATIANSALQRSESLDSPVSIVDGAASQLESVRAVGSDSVDTGKCWALCCYRGGTEDAPLLEYVDEGGVEAGLT